MKLPRSLIAMYSLLLLLAVSSAAQTNKITVAKRKITSAKFEPLRKSSSTTPLRAEGEPTFLNLDDPYQKEVLRFDLWERSCQVRRARDEISECKCVRNRKDHELSRSGIAREK